MTTREDLSFKSQVMSDTAALNGWVDEMLKVSKDVRAMRDPTRGGVATTLNEFARQSNIGIQLYTDSVPVKPEVKGACEVLGIDPLYVANEGKLIAVVPNEIANDMLKVMSNHCLGENSQIIGEATDKNKGIVVQSTGLGANRIIDMPIGEQLPRIC
jgi:hydrogenase expression/formation protein HypE